jgi:uncharacterized protein YjiS (DUF1127 family)
MLQDQQALCSRHRTLADNNQHTAVPAAPVGVRSVLLMLVQRLWRIIVAVKRRQVLTRLAELDDHLLADIGITRYDLSAADREPLMRDPTALLAQRACDRRDARQRSGRQFPDDVPHPASPSGGETSHVLVKAINFVGC